MQKHTSETTQKSNTEIKKSKYSYTQKVKWFQNPAVWAFLLAGVAVGYITGLNAGIPIGQATTVVKVSRGFGAFSGFFLIAVLPVHFLTRKSEKSSLKILAAITVIITLYLTISSISNFSKNNSISVNNNSQSEAEYMENAKATVKKQCTDELVELNNSRKLNLASSQINDICLCTTTEVTTALPNLSSHLNTPQSEITKAWEDGYTKCLKMYM